MSQNKRPRTQCVWEDSWTCLGPAGGGGQGTGFKLQRKGDRDGQPEFAFLKELNRWQDAEARQRMRREVTSLRRLKHAGIPEVIEDNTERYEDASVPLFVVLEYVDGETLDARVRRSLLDLDQAVSLCLALCEVVVHCHQHRVCHRDLKGSNVILRSNDLASPVVVDFGLSFNDEPIGDVTQTGERIANRLIELPELLAGDRDPISDITQLVAVLFWALTGRDRLRLRDEYSRAPHQDPGVASRLRAVAGARWDALRALFDTGFENHRRGRFQQVQDLIRDLDHLKAGASAVMPANSDWLHLWTQSAAEGSDLDRPPAEPLAARLVDGVKELIAGVHRQITDASGGEFRFGPAETVGVSPATISLKAEMQHGGQSYPVLFDVVASGSGVSVHYRYECGGVPGSWSGQPCDASQAPLWCEEYGPWSFRERPRG